MREYTKIETPLARGECLACKPEVDLLDRMGRRVMVKIKVKDFDC